MQEAHARVRTRGTRKAHARHMRARMRACTLSAESARERAVRRTAARGESERCVRKMRVVQSEARDHDLALTLISAALS